MAGKESTKPIYKKKNKQESRYIYFLLESAHFLCSCCFYTLWRQHTS